jgi:hypothetical protein
MSKADSHTTTNVVKFPCSSVSRHARRSRRSKNGRTPEEPSDVVAAKAALKLAQAAAKKNLDPAFALIAEKLAADVTHLKEIYSQDEAEKRFGHGSDEAWDAAENSEAACHFANEVDWKLANTPPATLAGVAAVLRFANEIEDRGMEWPDTDTIGPDGWHYQLRATMATAIEALTEKEVQS